MTTTIAMASALEEWALSVLPELTGSYDYAAAAKTQPLPDVAVEVDAVSLELQDQESLFDFEQTWVRKWSFKLLIMVKPEPGAQASAQLAGFIDRLQAAAMNDRSLGGRVPLVVLDGMAGNFTPPFVQFDDGTRGRVATLGMTILEPTEVE